MLSDALPTKIILCNIKLPGFILALKLPGHPAKFPKNFGSPRKTDDQGALVFFLGEEAKPPAIERGRNKIATFAVMYHVHVNSFPVPVYGSLYTATDNLDDDEEGRTGLEIYKIQRGRKISNFEIWDQIIFVRKIESKVVVIEQILGLD